MNTQEEKPLLDRIYDEAAQYLLTEKRYITGTEHDQLPRIVRSMRLELESAREARDAQQRALRMAERARDAHADDLAYTRSRFDTYQKWFVEELETTRALGSKLTTWRVVAILAFVCLVIVLVLVVNLQRTGVLS